MNVCLATGTAVNRLSSHSCEQLNRSILGGSKLIFKLRRIVKVRTGMLFSPYFVTSIIIARYLETEIGTIHAFIMFQVEFLYRFFLLLSNC